MVAGEAGPILVAHFAASTLPWATVRAWPSSGPASTVKVPSLNSVTVTRPSQVERVAVISLWPSLLVSPLVPWSVPLSGAIYSTNVSRLAVASLAASRWWQNLATLDPFGL